MSKRKQALSAQASSAPTKTAKWYRWLHPKNPTYGLDSGSDIAGIRKNKDRILPGEILPREWISTQAAFNMCARSGGLTEVVPEGAELLTLLDMYPAMKKHYGADFLKALNEQIEKDKLEEEEANG